MHPKLIRYRINEDSLRDRRDVRLETIACSGPGGPVVKARGAAFPDGAVMKARSGPGRLPPDMTRGATTGGLLLPYHLAYVDLAVSRETTKSKRPATRRPKSRAGERRAFGSPRQGKSGGRWGVLAPAGRPTRGRRRERRRKVEDPQTRAPGPQLIQTIGAVHGARHRSPTATARVSRLAVLRHSRRSERAASVQPRGGDLAADTSPEPRPSDVVDLAGVGRDDIDQDWAARGFEQALRSRRQTPTVTTAGTRPMRAQATDSGARRHT